MIYKITNTTYLDFRRGKRESQSRLLLGKKEQFYLNGPCRPLLARKNSGPCNGGHCLLDIEIDIFFHPVLQHPPYRLAVALMGVLICSRCPVIRVGHCPVAGRCLERELVLRLALIGHLCLRYSQCGSEEL